MCVICVRRRGWTDGFHCKISEVAVETTQTSTPKRMVYLAYLITRLAFGMAVRSVVEARYERNHCPRAARRQVTLEDMVGSARICPVVQRAMMMMMMIYCSARLQHMATCQQFLFSEQTGAKSALSLPHPPASKIFAREPRRRWGVGAVETRVSGCRINGSAAVEEMAWLVWPAGCVTVGMYSLRRLDSQASKKRLSSMWRLMQSAEDGMSRW